MKEEKIMGKKRYQMSADERDVHERAVWLRKMTDAQLVEHMEHVRSDAYAAGYAEGERKPAEAAGCGKGVLEFIEELSSGACRGVKNATAYKIEEFARERGYIV